MKCLFLDTSNKKIIISITEENKILFLKEESGLKNSSPYVLKFIKEGFEKVPFSIKDIDKIIVVNGPGSFTGVRIGITIAKTIGFSLKKDIHIISSLKAMITGLNEPILVSVIDARRDNVYAAIYDNNLNCLLEEQHISFDNLKIKLNDMAYKMVSFDEDYKELEPTYDIIKIINLDLPIIKYHELKPNYLKLTEAEEKQLNA